MARKTKTAVVGVADHAGWAVLVTVGGDGALLDRRRINLIDPGLPNLPHHHEAQALPLPKAIDLIARVRASAERHAREALATLERTIPIRAIALRECPPLPATIEERITNYRAQNVADTVMYRRALADAAVALGWTLHWYDARRVLAAAPVDLLAHTGARVGPPWQKDHRTAMAAALALPE